MSIENKANDDVWQPPSFECEVCNDRNGGLSRFITWANESCGDIHVCALCKNIPTFVALLGAWVKMRHNRVLSLVYKVQGRIEFDYARMEDFGHRDNATSLPLIVTDNSAACLCEVCGDRNAAMGRILWNERATGESMWLCEKCERLNPGQGVIGAFVLLRTGRPAKMLPEWWAATVRAA